MFLKVWKHYRGGSTEDYIILNGQEDKSKLESLAKEWAENTDGGHNYGYTVYWDKVDSPPKEWISKRIEYDKKRVANLLDSIQLQIIKYRRAKEAMELIEEIAKLALVLEKRKEVG